MVSDMYGFFQVPILTTIAIALSATAAVCKADPVIGNLTRPAVDGEVPVTHHAWQASSFRTAEDSGPWKVSRVRIRMKQVAANPSLTVRIVGERSGRPDLTNVRVEFANPDIQSGAVSVVAFSAIETTGNDPILEGGETYWLVLGVATTYADASIPGGLYYWSFAMDSEHDTEGSSDWSFAPMTGSAGTAGSNWASEATTPFTFALDAADLSPPVEEYGDNVALLNRWRSIQSGNPSIGNDEFLAADVDHDGLSGLLEFAFDSNRKHLPHPTISPDGRIGLTWVQWSDAPELTWTLQRSVDLTSWETIAESELEIEHRPLAAQSGTAAPRQDEVITRLNNVSAGAQGQQLRLHIHFTPLKSQ